MTQVGHDAKAVHLAYHLFSQSAYAVVCVTTLGTVADVVVAIMAEGDIHHSSLCKVFYVLWVAVDGEGVLYAEHYRFSAVAFVFI